MAEQSDTTRLIIPAVGPLYAMLRPISVPMIRFFAGLILMPHGAQKLFGWFGGGGLEGTAGYFSANLGLEPGLLFAALVGGTEFFGGLFLAIGFLTRPAAAGIAIVMAVAVFKVHMPNGFFWGGGGYEYPMLWGLIALAFFFQGGGKMSIDRTCFDTRPAYGLTGPPANSSGTNSNSSYRLWPWLLLPIGSCSPRFSP